MRYKITRILFFGAIIILLSGTAYSQWVSIGPDSGETSFCLNFDNNSNNLFLGTAEGFWYYNTNTGIWTRREDVGWIGRSVFAISAHPSVPGRILTGRMNAFFKGYMEYSNDWGITGDVSYFANGGNVTDIKNIPGTPNTFFACTWQDIAPGELLKSTDGGLNWVLLPNYIHFTMTEIAIDQTNPSTIYVSGDERVTKSTDGGVSWNVSSTGLPSGLGVYSVSVSPANGQILLASNDNGIYRSTNSGSSWSLVSNQVCGHFEFNPVNPLYAAAVTFEPYKILLSSDAGASWSDFSGNYSGDEVSDLAFNTSGTKLYVSSRMDGVFVHDFSFVPVELISFYGNFNEGIVTLEWTTATELNNHGFEVERSIQDNVWISTGFIKGAGTSSTSHNYLFTDKPEINAPAKIKYRLKQVDNNGTFRFSEEVSINVQPLEYSLEQNYPNPFNPSTIIRYSLTGSGFVELDVYNITGVKVKTLVGENQSAGTYEVTFSGEGMSSGVYFYKLRTNDYTAVRKMTLIK